ncbi:MAG TPA: hypothetical protein VFS00_32500 [Polyangiaceae bacterium]|nr:hypothetical protein [Polyangiaceae bacterium]
MACRQDFRPETPASRAASAPGRLRVWQPGRSNAYSTAGGALALALAALACSPAAPTPSPAPPALGQAAGAAGATEATGAAGATGATGAAASSGAASSGAPAFEGASGGGGAGGGGAAGGAAAGFGAAEVARFLFAEGEAARQHEACRGAAGGEALCLLDAAYAGDAEARGLARTLFERTGSIAGVEDAQTIDGGYRGPVRLVPALPKGEHRRHLAWAVSAFDEFDRFLAGLGAPTGGGLGAAGAGAARFRAGPVALRYYRSVGKRTPNAYAAGREIAYNVNGSINSGAAEVRDTLFHELFHLNDGERGGWSRRELGGLYAGIVRRCGANTACLEPYAPNQTKVRGGTYYAFQPGNDVGEYAAELAVRYLREHREPRAPRARAGGRAFKCGPPENARAWAAIGREFFAGVDRTAPCP